MTENRPDTMRERIASLRDDAAAKAFSLGVHAVLGTAAYIDARRQRKDMLQGRTEPKHISEQLGEPAERSLAYKKLWQTIDQHFSQKATQWIHNEHLEFWDEIPPAMHGRYDNLLLFSTDNQDGGGDIYLINRHTNLEYKADYGLMILDGQKTDGVRRGQTFSVGAKNWETAQPIVDVRQTVFPNDKVEEHLLSGEIVGEGMLGRALGTHYTESATNMSVQQAHQFAETIENLKPYVW